MNRTFTLRKEFSTDLIGEFADLSELDRAVAANLDQPTIAVFFGLGQPLQAWLLQDDEHDLVSLSSGEHHVRLTRNTSDNPEGDLEVCAERAGPISAINLRLGARDHSDPFIDRGLAWVLPGEQSIVRLNLRPEAFTNTDVKPSEIINEAVTAVQTQIIDRLAA